MKTPDCTPLTRPVELDLVIACATTVTTKERRAEIRRLAGECRDWDYFLKTCRAHGVSSLVCSTLEASAPDLIPREIREVLHDRFKANACRNLLMTQELLVLIREFRAQGIAMIPFKGPLLAITAYGNVALREFLDLDILVQKKDFQSARELLVSRGYRPPTAQAGLPAVDFYRSQLGCDFFRADGRVALELHWTFVQKWLGFHADLDAIWAAAEPVKVGPDQVLTLPADFALLYLCAHGAKHRWTHLCWVADVAEVLRTRPGLDWEALLTAAKRSGCQRKLFIGLYLAKTLLQAPIPENVWDRIRRNKLAAAMAENLAEQMFAVTRDPARQRFGWRADWFHIRTKERWREKLVYIGYLGWWIAQPNGKDREWLYLPRWLSWLYPLLRPVRLARQAFTKTAPHHLAT